jgi:gamma-glutamyltranspeptidase / glutathione hydrolase
MAEPTATRHARNGMVCSVDHLASAAGVRVLRAGGSAADAAVATSAVLAVTTQHMCGMGGDLFALVHDPAAPGPPAVLNASGRAGSGADPDRLRAEGHTEMPFRGDVRSTPVPGCVDGWLALHGRFGRLPLAEVLADAAAYAADGFPASPLLARALPLVAGVPGNALPPSARPGELVRRPGVAEALLAVVRDGRDGHYGGAFGEGLVEVGGGEFSAADLAAAQADWVPPLGVDAFNHRVWTVPPNSQGYLTVAGAWIADGLALPDDPDDPGWAHLLAEAAKQAGFDRMEVLHEHADGEALVAPDRLAPRRAAVDPDRAAALAAPAAGGGTIYLCTADGDGMAVSLIQSNAAGFGAHVVEPRTGIFLQNRGIGFSLVPGHRAEYGPGRRPPHTLSPALVTTADGRLRGVVGTMGGDTQPQVVLQLLARWLAAGQSPGRVVSAPRWALAGSGTRGFDTWEDPAGIGLHLEHDTPPGWVGGLRQRGHRVTVAGALDHGFGHAHLIEAGDDGVLGGAADPRALTGAAAGY